jgi:hypothetical protein
MCICSFMYVLLVAQKRQYFLYNVSLCAMYLVCWQNTDIQGFVANLNQRTNQLLKLQNINAAFLVSGLWIQMLSNSRHEGPM